jgi:hypothetical protein
MPLPLGSLFNSFVRLLCLSMTAAIIVLPMVSDRAWAQIPENSLRELSIEELMNLEVTTVSRLPATRLTVYKQDLSQERAAEGNSPNHPFQLQSSMRLRPNMDFDWMFRYFRRWGTWRFRVMQPRISALPGYPCQPCSCPWSESICTIHVIPNSPAASTFSAAWMASLSGGGSE